MLIQQTNPTPSFQEVSLTSNHVHATIKTLPGYHGEISSFEASQMLHGKQPGSYVTRWNASTERFACHVVQRGGHVEERPFSFDAKNQCLKNGAPLQSWKDLKGLFEHLLDHQVGLPV